MGVPLLGRHYMRRRTAEMPDTCSGIASSTMRLCLRLSSARGRIAAVTVGQVEIIPIQPQSILTFRAFVTKSKFYKVKENIKFFRVSLLVDEDD